MKTTNLLQNKKGIINHYDKILYHGADGGKSTATTDKLYALYLKSGSKKPFTQWLNDLKKSQGKNDTPILDWLQSDSAKKALNTAQTLVDTFQSGKNNDNSGSDQSYNNDNDGSEKEGQNEVTILGFHPITFALGSLFVLVGAYFGGRYLINKFSNNKN